MKSPHGPGFVVSCKHARSLGLFQHEACHQGSDPSEFYDVRWFQRVVRIFPETEASWPFFGGVRRGQNGRVWESNRKIILLFRTERLRWIEKDRWAILAWPGQIVFHEFSPRGPLSDAQYTREAWVRLPYQAHLFPCGRRPLWIIHGDSGFWLLPSGFHWYIERIIPGMGTCRAPSGYLWADTSSSAWPSRPYFFS
jgi:hypothetical protein